MLTDAQKQEFEQAGFVRIPNAFSIEDAGPMREAVYGELEKQCGIERDDPASWDSSVWPKFQDIKFDPVFESIGSQKTRSVLDELLGDWQEPSNWGQFLVSMPKPEEKWTVPHNLWHTDFGFDKLIDPLPGVLLISFITDVGPKCGGTAAISGGHHLVKKFVETKDSEFRKKMKRVRESFMKSDPWLLDLCDKDQKDRERLMNDVSTVQGIPTRVCELTGKTGDIIIGHPWLLHTSSINCGGTVSMRRVQRIMAGGVNRH
ncbi:MAG: hypothetical protein OEM82_03010 [Acidobacteriota bacterium]|nr:hypothetical protein [Acidobacteriota bacterium]